MRMGCALGAVVIATAACGSSTAAPTGSTADAMTAASCGAHFARTLVANSRARVFVQGGSVYGCALGHRRVYLLGRSALGVAAGQGRVGAVALGGVDAGYSTTQMGVDTGSTEVVVRRLDDGRTLHTASATTRSLGPESFQTVDALVVKSDGAVAWIASGSSIIRHNNEVEVDRIDRRGETTLDRGSGIGARSLRLRQSQLSWRHGNVTRSSRLL
ncbi:MAG TPA: hypothetical protein VKR21_02155 [Solirubrobacteraceae bacterium]|nr:hypothetical protein [Solirubrobacteraceae bacterium]